MITPDIDNYSIDYDNMNVDVKEFAIGGKLVALRYEVSDSKMSTIKSDTAYKTFIKKEMMNQLADYLLDNKLVEFTHQYSPSTGTQILAVRCYLAPDTQIKILRTVNK